MPKESLSADQRRALEAVLDEIIPPSPERGLPGAGEVGLAATIEALVAESPELREALDQADALARARGAAGFADLERTARRTVLDDLAGSSPGFVPSLVFPTFTGYYQAPAVMEALGLEARPPYPLGYPMEPLDLTLLEPVKQREKLFRDA